MDDHNETNYSIEHFEFYHEEESIEPPPPGLVTKFKTIQDWLQNICKTEHPVTNITTYNIGLFEAPGAFVLFLIGLNTSEKEKNLTVTTIEFEPANTYFPLPKTGYENLTREQVIDKITAQLKDFLTTETFRRSFMAKAKSITTDFAGEVWSNDGQQ